jgi:hypothetical protein
MGGVSCGEQQLVSVGSGFWAARTAAGQAGGRAGGPTIAVLHLAQHQGAIE